MKISILIFILLLGIQNQNLFAGEVVLENENIKAVFNDSNGALEQLLAKNSGWEIQRRRELAQSFLLHVPLTNQRFNPVHGREQKISDILEERDRIIFTWKNLQSENGGWLDIEFRGIVSLSEKGLVFDAEIKNNTAHVIESIHWPYLGDLTIPDGANQLHQLAIHYGGLKKLELFPKFANDPGYFGVDYPTHTISTPYSPFSLIDGERQGLYVGYLDTTAEHLVKFTARLLPGYTSYELWDTGVNPKADQISGHPVHLEFAPVHFPFVNPGERVKLHPIILQPYSGSWHKGADIYKEWRTTWFRSPDKPDWLKDIHSWQQIHMNNPEDDIRYRYNDLVRIGEDCAKYGVKAIQVTGWTIGGQDEGNPSHDIDQRLGTHQDLQEAIAQVQELGVKILLFTKFTWADRTTKWYQNELINYAVKDPYGNPWFHPGYYYQTPVQLAGINAHRFSPMCHLSAAWRDIANTEFNKAIALNADGMLYDENQHHGSAHYCFDASHGHHVPAHIFAGDYDLGKGFDQIRQKTKPNFLFAGEGHYDLEYRHYQVSYFRVDLNHVPIHRYVAPEEEMVIVVAGYNDRNMINLALLNRYIISYEPRNFKGRLDEFPLTMEYGKKVDDLRKLYPAYLWEADFRHTLGARVQANGKPFDTYTVFKNRQNDKRAVVVVNYDYDQAKNVQIKLEGESGDLWTVTPEDQDPKKYQGSVVVPPNSVVVLIEK